MININYSNLHTDFFSDITNFDKKIISYFKNHIINESEIPSNAIIVNFDNNIDYPIDNVLQSLHNSILMGGNIIDYKQKYVKYKNKYLLFKNQYKYRI